MKTFQRVATPLLLSFALLNAANATIIYDDGGTHDVDTTVNESIQVNSDSTLNVLTGASIGEDLGNDVSIDLNGKGFLNISGGSVTEGVSTDSTSVTTVTGGTIGGDLTIAGGSTFTLDGGTVTGGATVTEATFLYIDSGSIAGDISANDSAEITMTGGSIANLSATVGATFTISGGSVTGTSISMDEDAKASIYGGTINTGLSLDTTEEGVIDVYGYDFFVNDNPVVYDGTSGSYSTYSISDTSGILSGKLMDGSTIDLIFTRTAGSGGSGTIKLFYAIPEPASAMLMLCGAMLLVTRRRRPAATNGLTPAR